MTDLHGDVVALASLSKSATESTATFQFDEFGNPTKGSAGRYGWRKQRVNSAPSTCRLRSRYPDEVPLILENAPRRDLDRGQSSRTDCGKGAIPQGVALSLIGLLLLLLPVTRLYFSSNTAAAGA